jgi:hypothetical protein
MKKLLFTGVLALGTMAIAIQTSAVSDLNKYSVAASAKETKKSPTPRDLVYYKILFPTDNGKGC